MGGFCYGGSLPLKVDEAKRKIYENDELGMTDYPFREPKVFLRGYGEERIPQTCSSWSSDGVVLVSDDTVIEYAQFDFVEGLIRDQNGNVAWRSMGPSFTDEGTDGELLDEYRGAQRYMVTEYDLKTLTMKKYKVVLDESSAFDELDFYRLGEFLEGKIIDNHYVVDHGVLNRYIGEANDLVIPDSVTEISEMAFNAPTQFESVFIPETLLSIPNTFFQYCKTKRVSVSENNPRYYTNQGCLVDRYTKTLVWGYAGTEIPADNSINKIGFYAFGGRTDIATMVIPNTIAEIGPLAFVDCDNLVTVIIPEMVRKIGSLAFCGCCAMNDVRFPDTFSNSVCSIFGRSFVKEGDKWVPSNEVDFSRFAF